MNCSSQRLTNCTQNMVRGERVWSNQGINFFKQQEFQIVIEHSDFPVKRICEVLGINRSGFYKWRH